MKSLSPTNPGNRRSRARGAGLLETMLLLAVLLLAWSLAAGALGRWTEADLADLAARAAAIASQAERAGVRLVEPGDLDATLERIAVGGTAKSGPFAGQHYSLPELEAAPARRLKRHFKLEQGRLLVRDEGGSPGA